MIMTYDFIQTAKHNKIFRAQIDKALLSDIKIEIYTNMHKLTFLPEAQVVVITAKSDTSPFRHKIIPKKITYQAFIKILNGEWDSLAPNDIMDWESKNSVF